MNLMGNALTVKVNISFDFSLLKSNIRSRPLFSFIISMLFQKRGLGI